MPALATITYAGHLLHAHMASSIVALTAIPAKKKPTPSPSATAGTEIDSGLVPTDATPTPTPTTSGKTNSTDAINSIFDTVGNVISFLWHHPIIPIVIAALWAANWGWKKLTLNYNMNGKPLPTLSSVITRTRNLILKEDLGPVFTKPEKLASRMNWLTWRRYWSVLIVLALIAVTPLILPIIPFRLPSGLLGFTILVIAIMGIAGYRHVKLIFARRHRILMQMFEVSNSECHYPKGAELNPWGWVNITSWKGLYSPDLTAVVFPARFRSEDRRTQEAFEQNFNGTVSDAHTWVYKWESANNRVIVTPVPFIVTQAPYPFPDTHPWNEIPVGIGAGSNEVVWDCQRFPHVLVAGTTGSGKSVTQRTILLHCLQKEYRVVLIDPKRVELSSYGSHPHVLKIATELDDSVALIEQVEAEMHSRYQRMSEAKVNFFKNLADPPPPLLLMIDELFALLSPENVKSDEGKERDELHARAALLIGSIARLGRAAGVHMVLATQRPDAKILGGEVKANLDVRIAQGRMDTTPSLMTLDSEAATRIPGVKGRAMMRQGGDISEFQAYFLPNEALDQVLEMSAAIATGVISAEDLIAAVEGSREDGDAEGPSRVGALLRRIPVPAGLASRFGEWLQRRRETVEANESSSARFGEERQGRGLRPRRGRGEEVTFVPDADEPSVAEVAAEARAAGKRVESGLDMGSAEDEFAGFDDFDFDEDEDDLDGVAFGLEEFAGESSDNPFGEDDEAEGPVGLVDEDVPDLASLLEELTPAGEEVEETGGSGSAWGESFDDVPSAGAALPSMPGQQGQVRVPPPVAPLPPLPPVPPPVLGPEYFSEPDSVVVDDGDDDYLPPLDSDDLLDALDGEAAFDDENDDVLPVGDDDPAALSDEELIESFWPEAKASDAGRLEDVTPPVAPPAIPLPPLPVAPVPTPPTQVQPVSSPNKPLPPMPMVVTPPAPPAPPVARPMKPLPPIPTVTPTPPAAPAPPSRDTGLGFDDSEVLPLSQALPIVPPLTAKAPEEGGTDATITAEPEPFVFEDDDDEYPDVIVSVDAPWMSDERDLPPAQGPSPFGA